jgi:UDP-N-acetylglucosamine acyltransferase
MVGQDVPPFTIAAGDRARLRGVNSVGLRRRGFTEDTIALIKRAFRILVLSRLRLVDALRRIREELPSTPEIAQFVQFVEQSERGICR